LLNQQHYELKTQIAELEKQHDDELIYPFYGELSSKLEKQLAELEKQL